MLKNMLKVVSVLKCFDQAISNNQFCNENTQILIKKHFFIYNK